MFLHGGIFHILFNMLALWMFGTELERIWGTRYFLKFYFVTGIGAGVLTVLFSLLPFDFAQQLQHSNVIIGASGAIYGLLLAYALYFPDRPIYMYSSSRFRRKSSSRSRRDRVLLVAVRSRAASRTRRISADCSSAISSSRARASIRSSELKYRYLKWKINRVRKKFDVYSGGRADD